MTKTWGPSPAINKASFSSLGKCPAGALCSKSSDVTRPQFSLKTRFSHSHSNDKVLPWRLQPRLLLIRDDGCTHTERVPCPFFSSLLPHPSPTPTSTGALHSASPMPPTQPEAAFGILSRESPAPLWIYLFLFMPWPYLFAPSLSMVTGHMVSLLWVFPCNFDNLSICVNIYLAFILSKAHTEGLQ